MNLQLTSAARRAIAPGGAETRAVRLTRIAIGAGRGPGGAADADRVALRNPRDAGAVVAGDASGIARLTGSATIAPTGAYSVGEVGVFGRTVASDGALGDEILLAFWTHPSEVLAAAVVGVNVVVHVTIDTRAAASADIELRPVITFPAPRAFTGLTDTPAILMDGLLAGVGGRAETLGASAVAALLLAAAPPRMLMFDVSGSVVASRPCAWLVVAWGAGGAGDGRYDVARRRWIKGVQGAAGGDTSISPTGSAAQVRAAGGAGGFLSSSLPPRSAGSLGDLVVSGAGAAGGAAAEGLGNDGGQGDAGDLAISLFAPASGQYDVVIGLGGAGSWAGARAAHLSGSARTTGHAGRVMILEFR